MICFHFGRVMYRQIDVVTMGSPLDLIAANAFLCNFEKQWLPGCAPNILLKVFERYVDDTFVAFLCQLHFKRFCELHEHQTPKHEIYLKTSEK